MKIFITTGTYDYLRKIKEKHPEESMVVMLNEDGALLLHETNSKTLFKVPRRYDVIDSTGEFGETGYIVLNNIPVSDEGRPLFEYSIKNHPKLIEKEQGFIAIRVLRPLSSNTYIILTMWENEKEFQNWQNSEGFGNVHNNYSNINGIDSSQKIFATSSYLMKYYISE